MANRYFSSAKRGPKVSFSLIEKKRKSLLRKLDELDFKDEESLNKTASRFRDQGLDVFAEKFENAAALLKTKKQYWSNPEISERGFWQNKMDHSKRSPFDKSLVLKLIDFFKNEGSVSVCDLGCGCQGLYTLALKKEGIDCSGFDGNPFVEQVTDGVCKVRDLSEDFDDVYDWVLCLEVGEHIPKEYEKTFIENIHKNNRKGIILSWAIEGQGGEGHVNCRNNDYIKGIFSKLGYFNDEQTEKLFRENCDYSWFQNTTMVFRNLKDIT